ncbi:hypothetical protein V1514DRAFT_329645 [Lipomyces japonicus]|uniref:uncharacterized protein n=1 Tax=Lipomyces japonicus TaxID=56871 RepID=UPI0034CD59F8
MSDDPIATLAHVVGIRRFLIIDSQLSHADRQDLQVSVDHIIRSSMASGALTALIFSRLASRMRLLSNAGFPIRFARAGLTGLLGFFVGSHAGIMLGSDIAFTKYDNRPVPRAAMQLIREYPHLNKWAKFYNGDRQHMIGLVPGHSDLQPQDLERTLVMQDAIATLDHDAPVPVGLNFKHGIDEFEQYWLLEKNLPSRRAGCAKLKRGCARHKSEFKDRFAAWNKKLQQDGSKQCDSAKNLNTFNDRYWRYTSNVYGVLEPTI